MRVVRPFVVLALLTTGLTTGRCAVGRSATHPPAVGGSSLASVASERVIPSADRTLLIGKLRAALAAVPPPPAPYALSEDTSEESVADSSPWEDGAGRWAAPASAIAERIYEARAQKPEAGEPEAIEIRVELNGLWDLPRGLASVGGDPVSFPVSGATAVEVAMIAPDAEAGRVALPLSQEQIENRLAVICVYVGSARAERVIREAVEKGSSTSSTLRGTRRASDVQRLTIQLHGPKRTIEALASSVRVAALRRLLAR